MAKKKELVYGQPNCALPISFFEGRDIPDVHEDSLDYTQFWDEQIRRCVEGWSDGGVYAPGSYYYHINFKGMNRLRPEYHWKTPGIPETYIGLPNHSQEDLDFFLEVESCQKEGKGTGIIMVTGRGQGKSYNAATLCDHKYTFFPASECIISASTVRYAELLWDKVALGLNHHHSALSHLRLEDKNYKIIKSGYEETHKGKKKKYGYLSILSMLAYDDDPGKPRGARPDIQIFDEIGSWTGSAKLIDCYNMTKASWRRGGVFTGFPLLIGTGGEMTSGGSEHAREMFHNPKEFGLKEYYTDEGKAAMGKFIPSYRKFGGFYEDSGISDEAGAKAQLEGERKDLENNPTNYMQFIQEFPFTIEEAFLTKDGGWFPAAMLQDRIAKIISDPSQQIVKKGRLEWIKQGQAIVGIEWIDDVNGIFEKVEDPYKREGETQPPWHLYVSGCDSFDALLEGEDTNKSKGSIFIYKRFISAHESSHVFVAKLTQRTSDDVEFYQNTYKLNYYYHAQMLFEYTKIGIGRWYVTNKLSKYLMQRPKLEQEGIIKKTSSTNTYGIAMPEKVKVHAIKNYSAYIQGALAEGNGTVNIESKVEEMYFVSQLKDALEFSFGSSKYDETMAAAITLLAENELYNVDINETQQQAFKFPVFKTGSNGTMNFGLHD